MANPFRWCRVSHDCVFQINVVLVVVGVIFLLDVLSHLYLKAVMFPGLRLYPVALRPWLFWVRALTMVAYILNAVLGIHMARQPTVLKYAGYMLVGSVVLLYTISIGVTRFMYRKRFEFFAEMLVLQMWVRDRLGKVEVEFECCGRSSVVDYQTASSNRTWPIGSCCGKQNCTGCTAKLSQYLWTIEMDVARDNIIVSVLLFVAMIVMVLHFKDVQSLDDTSDVDESSGLADDSDAKE